MNQKFSFYSIGNIVDPDNDNIDVYVKLSNGKEYVVTFFTLNNIKHLMKKWKTTGENSGKYFWALNSCIIERLDHKTLEECINEMLSNGEFEYVFDEVKQANSD